MSHGYASSSNSQVVCLCGQEISFVRLLRPTPKGVKRPPPPPPFSSRGGTVYKRFGRQLVPLFRSAPPHNVLLTSSAVLRTVSTQ